MPQAPRIDPSAGLAPLPGVRVPTDAPAEAFGGGPGASAPFKVGEQALQEVRDRSFQEANDANVEDKWNKLVAAKNQALYDPQTGALARKGQNAFGVMDEYQPKFDKAASDLSESLANETQRHMFAHMVRRESMDFQNTLSRHIYQQSQDFVKDTHDSTIKTLQNQATLNFGDPAKISDSLNLQDAKIRAFGQTQGWSPETTDGEVAKAKSDTHVGVIDRMLDSNQPLIAESYLKAHQGEILATHLGQVTNAVKQQTIGYRGDDMASEILARNRNQSGNGNDFDISKVANAVDAIPDEKLRSETRRRVDAQLRQMNDNFNSTEGTLSSKIANGQLTQSELDQNRMNISNGFYQAAQTALSNVKAGTVGQASDTAKRTLVRTLTEQWGKVTEGDILGQSKRLMNYRQAVLARAGDLDPETFKTFLGISDPNFVRQITPEKKGWIQGAIDHIQDYFDKQADKPDASLFTRFLARATSPDTKGEDIPGLARQTITSHAVSENPALVGAGDIANNVADKGGIKQVYGGDTNLKPTQRISAPTTFKTGDEQKKGDVTYVRQEDGRWLPKPKPKR